MEISYQMTNHEIGATEYRVSYCPECGEDYSVAVSEDDEVRIICRCTSHEPKDFVEGLEEQLPLPTTEIEKINKKPDDRGFQ